jgi:hypothetical protein
VLFPSHSHKFLSHLAIVGKRFEKKTKKVKKGGFEDIGTKVWGRMGGKFQHHLVGWDKVCTPIANEGLGVKRVV